MIERSSATVLMISLTGGMHKKISMIKHNLNEISEKIDPLQLQSCNQASSTVLPVFWQILRKDSLWSANSSFAHLPPILPCFTHKNMPLPVMLPKSRPMHCSFFVLLVSKLPLQQQSAFQGVAKEGWGRFRSLNGIVSNSSGAKSDSTFF